MARYIKVEDIYDCLNEVKDCKDKQYAISLLDWAIGKRTITEDVIPTPNGATNGDMVKAMFPDYKVQVNHICKEVSVYYDGTEEYTGSWFRFDLDWWNAPYKKEWVNFAEELKDVFEEEVEE